MIFRHERCHRLQVGGRREVQAVGEHRGDTPRSVLVPIDPAVGLLEALEAGGGLGGERDQAVTLAGLVQPTVGADLPSLVLVAGDFGGQDRLVRVQVGVVILGDAGQVRDEAGGADLHLMGVRFHFAFSLVEGLRI